MYLERKNDEDADLDDTQVLQRLGRRDDGGLIQSGRDDNTRKGL